MLPRHFTEICRLVLAENDVVAARPWQAEANAVIALMLKYPSKSYTKAMPRFMGFDCGYCRGLFPPISEESYAAFANELREQGILREVIGKPTTRGCAPGET